MPKRLTKTKNEVLDTGEDTMKTELGLSFKSLDSGVELAERALAAKKKSALLINLSKAEEARRFHVKRFRTNILSLNKMFSGRYGGGWPIGRLLEIIGYESVGKTTLTLQLLGEFINTVDVNGRRPRVLYIDAEYALDQEYAMVFNIDTEDSEHFLYSQPDTAEDALDLIDSMASSRAIDMVVVDSIAGLATQEEMGKSMDDGTVATLARKLSTFFRKSYKFLARNDITMIAINQFRQNMVAGRAMGKTAIGGNALRFWTSVKLELDKDGGNVASIIYDAAKNPIGNRIRIKAVKNKTYIPNVETTLDLIHGKGFSWSRDMINIAAQNGIITKSGTWLAYGKTQLGQGLHRASTMLEENPDLAQEIRMKILELDDA